jgi:hypothetical protein
MLAAETAVLAELQFLGGGSLVLRGGIVALLALGATKCDDVSRHVCILLMRVSRFAFRVNVFAANPKQQTRARNVP